MWNEQIYSSGDMNGEKLHLARLNEFSITDEESFYHAKEDLKDHLTEVSKRIIEEIDLWDAVSFEEYECFRSVSSTDCG